MMDGNVHVTIEDGVAVIRFDRPSRLNALNVTMGDGFENAVEAVVLDPKVRAVILSGEGRAFMAGGDLAYFRDAEDRSKAARRLVRPVHAAILKLKSSGLPTLSALHGPVAGAGMSLAIATDLAVAADDTTFNMAYLNVGANPDCGGSWSLVRLVGTRKATELALLSETIDSTEALRLGLVNKVVPRHDLDNTVRTMAIRLASAAPLAVQRTKALLDMASLNTFSAHLDLEIDGFAACAQTEDFGEALTAFFEKRSPRFVGR